MVYLKKQPVKEEQSEEHEELKPFEKEDPKEIGETIPIVVKDLPTEPVRIGIGKDDKRYAFFTIEEALTELLVGQKELLKIIKS